MKEKVATLTIPKYPTKIKMSEKTQTKYYRKRDGKWKPRKLPPTYREKLEKGIWKTNKNHYLVNEDGDRVVANPRKAGKPNYEYLSGNRFTTGFGHYMVRKKIVDGLKEFYKKHIDIEPIERFPLIVEWEFHSMVTGEPNFDMSNFWFYYKYLEDSLVDEGILPDDSIPYITGAAGPIFVPVEDWQNRKFVFHFYHDKRESIHNRETWSK